MDQDPYLEGIAKAKVISERRVDSIISENADRLAARFGQDLKLKERLSHFARKLNMDEALISVWDELRYYPSWTQDANFKNSMDVSDVFESVEDGGETVHFTFNETRMSIWSRQCQSFAPDGTTFLDLSLREAASEVFAILCIADQSSYGIDYRCIEVLAFRKRGSWPEKLFSLHGNKRLAKETAAEDRKYTNAPDIRERFEE